MPVGVGNAKVTEDGRFETLHFCRFGVMLVIIAKKVEKAMDDEMGEVVGQRQVPGRGLRFYGFPGQNDIAEERPETAAGRGLAGKGEDVGGLVLPPEFAVEDPYSRIIGKNDSDLGAIGEVPPGTGGSGRNGPFDQPGERPARRPALRLDEEIDGDRRRFAPGRQRLQRGLRAGAASALAPS